MFTLITTYYEEPELLERFLTKHRDSSYNVIVVDDGSVTYPALDTFNRLHVKDISLYRVEEDLGFNSHGARNLAMQHTTTKWNMLVDIDYDIQHIEAMYDLLDDLDEQYPHFFPVSYYNGTTPSRVSINDFFVTTDTFWEAGGYDTEFIGMHYGDRMMINRMKKKRNPSVLFDGAWLKELRSQRNDMIVIESDIPMEATSAKEKKMVYSTAQEELVKSRTIDVLRRWLRKEMCDPVPFKWIKQI